MHQRTLSATVRLLAAVFAAVMAFAPGIAAIVDAAPAARAISEQAAPHVDETGSRHDHRAHVDDCTTCRLATRASADRAPAAAPLLVAAVVPRPEFRVARPRTLEASWTPPSRGPPAV